jgi:ABC-type nitrate/sulfonate/bicarbonate transport system permease component
MLPFVTLARSLPTAVLMALISIFLITVLPLVPITVAFFIIFPMMFAGFEKAINNINKDSIDVAKVFHISK